MGTVETGKLKTRKLTPTVGAEVLEVDVDRLLADEDLPPGVLETLEEYGVLLFRELHVDDHAQVAFARRLGDLSQELTEISLNPDNPFADALQGTVEWHMDGTTRGSIPDKATILTAKVVAPRGGETEFASSYAAYEALSAEEQERCARLRAVHSFAATQRSTHPDPSPELLADWESRGSRPFPLVWSHRSGRRSLVIGSSADHIVGMEREESRALLDDLLRRATAPDRVYTHRWAVGDMVIWDNPRMLHRVLAFDRRSGRELHRTSLAGDEPIQ
jgi:alpha-ketoglutarate-dependent taurine dioxygenase